MFVAADDQGLKFDSEGLQEVMKRKSRRVLQEGGTLPGFDSWFFSMPAVMSVNMLKNHIPRHHSVDSPLSKHATASALVMETRSGHSSPSQL